jgi:hypothetical protein
VIDAEPVSDVVPETPGCVTPGRVAMIVAAPVVACRHVTSPVVLTGASLGSDEDHVTPVLAGVVHPVGTISVEPNCWALLPELWFTVAVCGKTDSAVGEQLVELLPLPPPQPMVKQQSASKANESTGINFISKKNLLR